MVCLNNYKQNLQNLFEINQKIYFYLLEHINYFLNYLSRFSGRVVVKLVVCPHDSFYNGFLSIQPLFYCIKNHRKSQKIVRNVKL